MESLGYDRLLGTLPPMPSTSEVVVVDVDEKSMAELGQWPWPRYQVAQILDEIHRAGAISVGVDFLFTEPDRLSLNRLRDSIQRGLNVDLDLTRVPEALRDNDAILARSLAETGAFLGIWFDFEEELPTSAPRLMPIPSIVVTRSPGCPEYLPVPQATGALEPIPN